MRRASLKSHEADEPDEPSSEPELLEDFERLRCRGLDLSRLLMRLFFFFDESVEIRTFRKSSTEMALSRTMHPKVFECFDDLSREGGGSP